MAWIMKKLLLIIGLVCLVGRAKAAWIGSGTTAITSSTTGSLAALTNGPVIPGYIWSQAPMWPLINANTFEAANPFTDTNWNTNMIGVPTPGQPQYCYCSESWVSNTMAIMKRSGIQGLGSVLITLGDGQYLPGRDANGNLQANRGFFPQGFQWLTANAKTNGFLIGSYLAIGDHTPCGCPGSGMPYINPSSPSNIVDRLAQDIVYNYTNGFAGVYIDVGTAYGGVAYTYDTNRVPLMIRAAIREANEMVMTIFAQSGNEHFERHPFYVGGPTANYSGALPYSIIEPDVIYGSTSLGLGPQGIGVNPFTGSLTNPPANTGVSNNLLNTKAYMAYGWTQGPGHAALFLSGYTLNSDLYPGQTSDWSVAFAMIPSQWEYGIGSSAPICPNFQNVLLQSIARNPAQVCAQMVYSNNLAEIAWRPLGGTNGIVGQSNVIWVVNENNSASQTITVSNSMMGLPAYQPMIAYDVLNHAQLTNYSVGFSVTVLKTNQALIYCYPWDPLNNPSTNPPPAAFYPGNSRVLWQSNSVGQPAGNVYALRNDVSRNSVWVSTNLVETAPAPSFQIATNAQLRVDWDPDRSGYLPFDLVSPLRDFGPFGMDLRAANGLTPGYGTNFSGALHGRTSLYTTGTTTITNVGWSTGYTNGGLVLNQPLLIYVVVDNEQQVSFGDLICDITGNALQIYSDSTGAWSVSGGSPIVTPALVKSTTPRVLEFYCNNTLSFIKTNNPATGFPSNCISGTIGTGGITGVVVGANNAGGNNFIGQIGRLLIFTNASTLVNTPTETNIFTTLSNL